MELGVGNVVEEIYSHEADAREAASALWVSWVLFYTAHSKLPSELCSGGIGFAHEAIRRHVEAQHHPDVREREASEGAGLTELTERVSLQQPASPEADREAEVVKAGTLEKKPVRGFGLVERGVGGGWRVRRILLRQQSIEWKAGDDSDGELQVLLLHPVVSTVRAAGDGRLDGATRCLSVSGIVDGANESLVLRAADEVERDAWLRAICKCIESLKAHAFDAAVDAAAKRLQQTAITYGEVAKQHAAVREGVRLLMERFFSPSSLDLSSSMCAESARLLAPASARPQAPLRPSHMHARMHARSLAHSPHTALSSSVLCSRAGHARGTCAPLSLCAAQLVLCMRRGEQVGARGARGRTRRGARRVPAHAAGRGAHPGGCARRCSA